jgi:methyl-accepting chemotaxis protein
MFDRWSLKAKLIAFALFGGVCLLVVGGVGIYALKNVSDTYQHVSNVNLPNTQKLSRLLIAQRDMAGVVLSLVNTQNTREAALKGYENYKKFVEDFEKTAREYEAVEFAEGEEQKWSEVMRSWKNLKPLMEKVIELSTTGLEEDRVKRDVIANGELPRVRVEFRELTANLVKFQDDEAKKWGDRAENTRNVSNWILSATVLAGFIIALMIGIYMASSISRTMSQVAGQLSTGADEVTSAATEISSTAEQLSASAVEQASSLQETASSIEEMSSMVKQNAANAARSSETAKTGQETAGRGKQVILEMLGAMGEIDAANKEIGEVVKVIGQIGNKTKVIDDIVFKTQLLSFNASVEAARAGEHGKGFAVVAEEVGNLAQMSGNAAREISEMLEQSLERVERMIQTSKQKVEVGLNVGKRCGDVLDELVESVSEVNNMANEIASACQEQSRGITEINRAVTQMDQVTQQNASASQQSAAASEQLSHQAESLRVSVEELLRLLNGSERGSLEPAPAAPIHHARKSMAQAPVRRSMPQEPASRLKKSETVRSVEGVPSNQNSGFDEAA